MAPKFRTSKTAVTTASMVGSCPGAPSASGHIFFQSPACSKAWAAR